MKLNPKIVITTSTFSKNETLMEELRKSFSNIVTKSKVGAYTPEELLAVLNDADAGIIGLEIIDESVLKHCPNLKILSKFGVGLDNINISDCEKRGIAIGWKPGTNKRSVAELALCFMLSLTRNVCKTSNQLKQGIWNKNGGTDLTGKTVGIIGAGNVGKELISLLKPFHCKILVNDIINQKDYYLKEGIIESTKEEIFKNSDFISLHVPLTNLTSNLINKKSFNLMKSSAFLINTARGQIVNNDDLLLALKDGKIAGAAIDVYLEEPPKNRELIEHPNLICTPHIAGNSKEAVLAMGFAAIDELKSFFKNK
ncbi:MAG: phosphoglycerate dehydrogenase [Nanoarchaeota archaeon]